MKRIFLTVSQRLLVFGCLCLAAAASPATEDDQTMVTDIIQTLADDQTQGRAPTSKGSKQTLAYLENWLSQQGLSPAGKRKGSFRQPFRGGTNLVAIWRPQNAPQAAPVVLLSAHFDHLASGCTPHASAHSSVCNGAADNAAGVAAALLATTHLRDANQMAFALLLGDGEEAGLAGSRAFMAKPSIDLSELALVINLDIVGLDLFKGMENHHLVFGVADLATPLQVALQQRLSTFSALQLHHFSYALSHGRSDHTSFMTAKKPIPSLLLSDGSGGPYHSAADEASRVNMTKVVAVAQLATEIALATGQVGKSHENMKPANLSPSFSDAQALRKLLNDVFEQRQANGLYGIQLAKLRKQMAILKRTEKAGEAAFAKPQAEQVGGMALELLQLSRERYFQNATHQKK